MSNSKLLASALLGASLCLPVSAFSDEPRRNDNTGKNRVEAPTADQTSNAKSDVNITAEIRRAIMKDNTLSTSAHNVKIIVESGLVTLKGPVKNADEKMRVCAKANEVVGATNVKNQIEIAP